MRTTENSEYPEKDYPCSDITDMIRHKNSYLLISEASAFSEV